MFRPLTACLVGIVVYPLVASGCQRGSPGAPAWKGLRVVPLNDYPSALHMLQLGPTAQH